MKFCLENWNATHKNKKFNGPVDHGRKGPKDRLILTPHLNVEESELPVLKGYSPKTCN